MKIDDVAVEAAKCIRSFPQKSNLRIISHYDADGISAAAIICHALIRADYNFHATLTKTGTQTIQDLKNEDNDLVIFCDMGSGQLKEINEMECKIIICDHHIPQADAGENVIHLNSNVLGYDGGREACAATMAFTLAQALDEHNKDLIWLAVTGAIGDRQGEGGFQGYNKKMFDEGIANEFIYVKPSPILLPKPIQDSLESSINPFFVSFSGKKNSSLPLLKELGIPSSTDIADIVGMQLDSLFSRLTELLRQQGAEAPQNLLVDTPFSQGNENLSHFASLLNACGRRQQAGLGLSICLDDKELYSEGKQVLAMYQKDILDCMIKIEKEGVHQLTGLQYFYIDHDTLGGTIAGLALKYFPHVDKNLPIFSLSPKGEKIHISGRTTHALVKQGINLAEALHIAATHVGGNGGGHPIAAGATIPQGTDKEFLSNLDFNIRQAFKAKTN